MPDATPCHVAGGGECPSGRVIEFGPGRPAECLATSEQYSSVCQQSGGGVIGNRHSAGAKRVADRVIELRWVLSGKQDPAVGQESSGRAKVASSAADVRASSREGASHWIVQLGGGDVRIPGRAV